MKDAAPTHLSPNEILETLGAGGMGVVYQARDRRLDRDVAIKVILQEFAADPERIARLEREAKSLAALNHPAIATLFGSEHADGRDFLVMELVPGLTLAEILAGSRLLALQNPPNERRAPRADLRRTVHRPSNRRGPRRRS